MMQLEFAAAGDFGREAALVPFDFAIEVWRHDERRHQYRHGLGSGFGNSKAFGKKKMTTRKVLVKVQLPLDHSGEALALVYDEQRSCEGLVPITPDIKRLMAGSVKKFFNAEVDEDGIVELMGLAPWQNW